MDRPCQISLHPSRLMNDITWSDPQRQSAFTLWLEHIAATQRLVPNTLSVASTDASFRRYFRILTREGSSHIIMDAPPEKENCLPFVQVAQLMKDAGVPGPEVLAWNEPQGFMLLSDLGQLTLLQHLQQQPEQADAKLRESLDVLVQWQLASKPNILPAYDRALLRRELDLFSDWYIVQHKSWPANFAQRDALSHLFEQIMDRNLAAPSVYVHRDFMPRNLMVSASGQLGVVDFQDAVYGPITYDIASLMRDAFHTWEEERVVDITIRYWEKAKRAGLLQVPEWESDFGEFWKAVDWMALQRHLKILGIFARLTLRDGKPKYLADTPRFVLYVRDIASRYRELTPLLRLIDELENLQAATGFAYGRS